MGSACPIACSLPVSTPFALLSYLAVPVYISEPFSLPVPEPFPGTVPELVPITLSVHIHAHVIVTLPGAVYVYFICSCTFLHALRLYQRLYRFYYLFPFLHFVLMPVYFSHYSYACFCVCSVPVPVSVLVLS